MPIFSSQALLAASVSASALLGAKSVHTEVIIPSAPENVWQVLADIERYYQWNPAITLVNGELKEGNKVTYRFQETDSKAANISSRVIEITPHAHLNHNGGVWGIITFDQHYYLEPHELGTKFIIHEDYTGVYVNFWDETHTQQQYQNMADALKHRVLDLYPSE
ncbi:SRPBCC family protein [Vibrio sp. D404a]|uniref:SRPBCC family protein n=1 Tax=unclassified Vibrio TaxID=2614977 RepID=UPI002555A3F8|nr:MULTISPECIES: SRPBCC family protein [unclassified Vibrio]MDK9735706.1 SRPBCC family protein [Vibrio sp. D404a]MDK9798622.1 SRPBCC family protein [Vibrio sp. D449a]